MITIRVLILTLAVFVAFAAALQRPQEVRYQWNYLNYTWLSSGQYNEAVANGDYIPKYNYPSGIKIWNDLMYLTVPRFRTGVPASLVTVPVKPVHGNRSPNAKPYPNWQMQTIGDCNALQSVVSMEIDETGRMWVLDTGRNTILGDNETICPSRLVGLDLNDNGRVILSYVFPEDVVDPKTGILNDLVWDKTDDGYIYITNTDSKKPSLVVFSLRHLTSLAISHPSMYPTDPVFTIKADNEIVRAPLGIDGIALSTPSRKGHRTVYYSPLSSFNLYSISTDVLKNSPEDFHSRVKFVGRKPSQGDGMIMTDNNELYFGLLTDSEVSKWNTREKPFSSRQRRSYGDNKNLVWPHTFAIDENKKLWITAAKIQRVLNNDVDINEVNSRVVLLAQLEHNSYIHYGDDTTDC